MNRLMHTCARMDMEVYQKAQRMQFKSRSSIDGRLPVTLNSKYLRGHSSVEENLALI